MIFSFFRSVLLTIALSISVNAIYGYESVYFNQLFQFTNGQEVNQFRNLEPKIGDVNHDPKNIIVAPSGYYISDDANQRLIHVSREGEWSIVFEGSTFGRSVQLYKNFLIVFGRADYEVIDIVGKQLSASDHYNLSIGSGGPNRIVIIGDMLLIQQTSRSPEYLSFHFTDDFDGEISLMNPAQTISYLRNDYDGTEDFTVDERGYILWNGRVVSPEGRNFYRFFYQSPEDDPFLHNAMGQLTFIGWDPDGNSVWQLFRRIFILSNSGKLIADFIGENVNPTIKTRYAISENGTVYCLSFNAENDEFELLSLEPFWLGSSGAGSSELDSQNPQATVINSRLRVRSLPSLEGEMLGMLEIGEAVTILEKSEQELNIGELTDFWYRIDNGNGLVGWAYGAFLNIED
jgi:hypothetical protein